VLTQWPLPRWLLIHFSRARPQGLVSAVRSDRYTAHTGSDLNQRIGFKVIAKERGYKRLK